MGFQKRILSHRGITVIQKRDPAVRPLRPGKVALVLAGGGASGGAYKAGALAAMDEFFDRRVGEAGATRFGLCDFDLYIGLSAGSVLATFLAGGMSPQELVTLFARRSGRDGMRPLDLVWPNLSELPRRFASFLGKEQEILTNYFSGATSEATGRRFSLAQTLGKMATSSMRLLPTGLFDSGRLERYVRASMERARIPTEFDALARRSGKGLYMTATDLNRGRLIVFGHDEPYGKIPIPKAIAASCALPMWYRPVRIDNPLAGAPGEPATLDLVDGSLMRTANVRLAAEKGAELVICYNPFAHIVYDRVGRSLYEHGAYAMASQVLRILIGARLHLAKELIYSSDDFDCDVVFIEPAADDYTFFLMNPMSVWTTERAARHGRESVRNALLANREILTELFQTHGIEVRPSDDSEPGRPGSAQPVELRESHAGR